MAGNLGPRIGPVRFVAKDDSRHRRFLGETPAAMIGESRVVVAEDPGPFEPVRHRAKQLARLLGQPVAAEAIVETVAEAVEPSDARRFDQRF